MHEIDDGLQVVPPAAEVCLAHFVLAFSPSSPAHLAAASRLGRCAEEGQSDGSTYSIAGPTRSRPILALWRITRLAGTACHNHISRVTSESNAETHN